MRGMAASYKYRDFQNHFEWVYRGGQDVCGDTQRDGQGNRSLGLETCTSEEKWGLEALASREIGYVLSKAYWGYGYMTEAARAVIPWLFACGAEVIYCGHFAENDRSRRVIEKCGFVPLGHVSYQAKQLGKTFDGVMYLLRRSEWNG